MLVLDKWNDLTQKKKEVARIISFLNSRIVLDFWLTMRNTDNLSLNGRVGKKSWIQLLPKMKSNSVK